MITERTQIELDTLVGPALLDLRVGLATSREAVAVDFVEVEAIHAPGGATYAADGPAAARFVVAVYERAYAPTIAAAAADVAADADRAAIAEEERWDAYEDHCERRADARREGER